MSELKFNIAQLLQEYVGATREYEFDEPELDLGDGLWMRPSTGWVYLIRTKSGVLADIHAEGAINQDCVRCLETYAQPVSLDFEEEFYATVHATEGTLLPEPDADDVFRINSNHLLDVGDAIREYALLALPIAPVCREACPGIAYTQPETPDIAEDADQEVDDRLAALKQLLNP